MNITFSAADGSPLTLGFEMVLFLSPVASAVVAFCRVTRATGTHLIVKQRKC